MPINRREFLASAAAAVARPARRTNVVVFMTDDHGAWATGAYGCGEMHTPNIDRLASGGALFNRAYACTPVCSPSRVTYLTGQIPSQHGVQDWLRPGDSFGAATLRPLAGRATYSEVLARHGYTLGMCGKWHMGDDEKAQCGFTYWHTVPGGGGTYQNPEFVTNGQRRKLTGFKTDLVTDGALSFLDTVKDKPFFLLVPFFAPHTPFNYQPEPYRKPYRNARFSCFPDTPMHPWQNSGLARNHGQRDSKLAYSALITGVDHNVGRVLRRLEELKLRDDTLIVFTADQGWSAGHHGVWGKGNGTVPYNMYEEAIRVPMIWHHPARIRGGRRLDPMISSYDFFPTILDYLGVPAPKDSSRPGRSYAGFLTGKQPAWRNRLFFEYGYVRAVRTENMKYIERTEGWPSELFDLEADPGETRNVIADPSYAKVLAGLRGEMGDFFRRAGAPPLAEWRTTTKQQLTEYRRHLQ